MRTLSLLVAMGLIAGAAWSAEAEPELESIFNGKDLTGWTAGKKENIWWTVKDGVLVGQSDPKKKGSVLQTEKKYTDLIVEAEVRFSGEIDSGIFVRKGWQCQIGVSRSLKKDMTCSVYARGKYENRAQNTEKLLKKDDWNLIRIEAKGNNFKIFLNKEKVLEFDDKGFPGPAPIGLQIHGGLDMKVEFRNIKAKEL
jgi:hypothetical protein